MFYMSSPLDSFFEKLFSQVPSDYYVDENEDNLTLSIELPGYDKGKISVLREDRILTVSAERNVKTKYGSKENSYSRRFILPDNTDLEKINPEYKDGILSIEIKKHEGKKPLKIEVK